MSESDDPGTIGLGIGASSAGIGSAAFGRGSGSFFGPSREGEVASPDAQHASTAVDATRAAASFGPGAKPTAPRRITGDVFGDRGRRKRLAAASVLTRDWLPPTLGTPGLVGIG